MSIRLQTANKGKIASPRERCLESERHAFSGKGTHFLDHHSSGPEVSGANGVMPCAMRSAFTKFLQSEYFGRNPWANVILPAPSGPAIQSSMGIYILPNFSCVPLL